MKFPYKNPPSEFQRTAMVQALKRPCYALFHAMGAGKTYSTINVLAARSVANNPEMRIDRAVIICPSAIKSVWATEFEKHSPFPYSIHAYKSGGDSDYVRWLKNGEPGLKVLTIGVEALSQGKAFDIAMAFIQGASAAMMVCDESSRIKNHSATRTKKAYKLAHACKFRMILTGTPITQGIQDLYSQFYFLDPDIIGLKSYVLFRNMYCVMGGFQNRSIIAYQNMDNLIKRLQPWCDIVTKEEALPQLPPKIYADPILVSPTSEQKSAMKQLQDQFVAQMSGDTLTVSTVMDRLTRYQQICGGFYPFDDTESGGYRIRRIEGRNPKLEVLLEYCESVHESGQKAIIWARFRPELEMIAEELRKVYGDRSALEFHGGVDEDTRAANTKDFENDPECRFMVANATVGGMGQTWISATNTFYYSNTFSYEDRMQSEDRNHRRGQHNSVVYRDITMNVKADKMIMQAIRRKHDLAMEVKDGLRATIDLGEED